MYTFNRCNILKYIDDARNTVVDWYYNILRDGGYLWCRNPLTSTNPIPVTNVFHRMRMLCGYKYDNYALIID